MPPVSHDVTTPALASAVRQKLLLRDTLVFVTLLLFTVVLFVATLFLFRSFAAHQQQLAVRWSTRGRAELAAGHPDQAVQSLRTALTYAPAERSYELLLAEALGDAGHVEESFTYFTGLWDRQPGDGLINLRLARLAALKGEGEQAVNFYRASVYGTWPGDAIQRRMEVRLELARYLIARRDLGGAREELLIAGGNAGRNAALETQIASLLEQAQDPQNALLYNQRAATDDPRDAAAPAAVARLSFALGNYAAARQQADRALHLMGSSPATVSPQEIASVRALRAEAERTLELDPRGKLSRPERVARIVADAGIVRTRLQGCLANPPAALTDDLAALTARWDAASPTLTARALSRDDDAQDAAITLIDDTERQTRESCGAPTGDDALLLRLAEQHAASTGG